MRVAAGQLHPVPGAEGPEGPDPVPHQNRAGPYLGNPAAGQGPGIGRDQALADLSQALVGRFTDHHAVLCRLHLDRIALFNMAVTGLEEKIAVKVTPYQRELDLLKSTPGFGDAVACAWLAEIGPAPHEYFASHEKLASWVTLCPDNHMSADFYARGESPEQRRAYLLRQLEKLSPGCTITITPAEAA